MHPYGTCCIPATLWRVHPGCVFGIARRTAPRDDIKVSLRVAARRRGYLPGHQRAGADEDKRKYAKEFSQERFLEHIFLRILN